MEFISDNLIAIFALAISVITFISARRGITSRARAQAMSQVSFETARLEEEIRKLQQGLNRCIRERTELKEAIQVLRKKAGPDDKAQTS